MKQASSERQGGARLAERLRERRAEIEQITRTRILAVSVLPRAAGPEYAEGLRGAVSAGIDYGIEGIERGEGRAPPIPEALLSQARLAARSGVSLDTVLRRYIAGHALLADFLLEEAMHDGLEAPVLKRLLRSQAAIVDRLLTAVSEAFREESQHRNRSSERRRAERIERLLSGELLDTTHLAYDFEGWHLGLVVSGEGATEAVATLAGRLDRRLLTVQRGRETIWSWLGSRRRLDPGRLEELAGELPAGPTLAVGEPGEGLSGWRLTHRQARAAQSIALRSREAFVRYADVALDASMLQDDLLTISLRQLYLDPLDEAALETLRAYFAAERHALSAAAALGVSRRTIARRLRSIEARLGRSLNASMAEIEAALRLRSLRADALSACPSGDTT
jgi:GGDEF-like domain/PucR C-terminal helix-turn-helix domain